jgi:phosphoglycerol transferase MdoB-like AlkP superfamily enzyme
VVYTGNYQEHILSSFNQLAEISSLPGSKFVYFHVLAPHAPFIFDQNGPITPDKPYYLVRDFRGTQEERISGYIGQVSYLNWQVEKAIDAILENSSVSPIIIIQGDHGPGIYLNSKACLRERTSILNAYYLPGVSNNPIYETITPVNSFRIIFNQYFGAQFKLLDDRVYYNGNGEDFKFVDVTQESQTCVLP